VQDSSIFLPSMNVINSLPSGMMINKPIGFRTYLCDLCLYGSVEAVWKFVDDGSLAKVNHTCNAEQVVRTKSLPEVENKRRTLHEASFRVLKNLVNSWIGRETIFLKAEELSSGARYECTTGKNSLQPIAKSAKI